MLSDSDELPLKYWKTKIAQKQALNKICIPIKPKKVIKKDNSTKSKPKINTVKIIDRTFEEVINKFKNVFQEKPKTKQSIIMKPSKGMVKGKKSQGSTMQTNPKSQKKLKTNKNKTQVNALFTQMQKKLQEYRLKAKKINQKPYLKSKSKSRQKIAKTARSKSQKNRFQSQMMTKSISIRPLDSTARKRIMTEHKKQHSYQNESPYNKMFTKYRAKIPSQTSQQDEFNQNVLEKQNSVIVYDISSEQNTQINLNPFIVNEKLFCIKTIQKYILGFHTYLRLQKHKSENKPLCQSKSYSLQILLQQQRQRWLRLKLQLQALKDSQLSGHKLEEIIKEVDDNRMQLQDIQIWQDDSFDQKQSVSGQSRRLTYDEAPEQIKSIMQRKPSQESIKESQKKSMELSRKHLIQDIEVMEFMQRSQKILFQKSPSSSLKQLNGPSSFERYVQPIAQKPLPEDIFQLSPSPANAFKTNHQNMVQIENIIPIDSLKEQEDDQEEFNQFVQAQKMNIKRQKVNQYIYDLLLQEVTNDITLQIRNRLYQSYNNQTVDIYNAPYLSGDDFLQRTNSKEQSFDGKIQADDQFIMQLFDQIKQFIKGSVDVGERLRYPLGVRSLFFLKCMRILSRKQEGCEDGDELDQQLRNDSEEIENYQDIISREDLAQFQQRSPQYNSMQLIFNRCLYEYLNAAFDEYRPFGKKGRPPICFQNCFPKPILAPIYKAIKRDLSHILAVKLGFLSFKKVDATDVERIVLKAEKQFKIITVKEIEEQYHEKSQDIFQISYDLQNIIESTVFQSQIQIISAVFNKRK